MRIAVVADIHGNVRALPCRDGRSQGGRARPRDQSRRQRSGPLEAAETADLLISLAWTTVRGNHDRQLLDRPVEQMGRSDQAACAELRSHHSSLALNSLDETVEFEGLLFCHGTPDNDHVYLCETVEPDGRVRLATRSRDPRRLAGVPARSRAVRAQPYGALRRARSTTGWWSIRAASACPPIRTASRCNMRCRWARRTRATPCSNARKASDPWQVTFRVVAYDWGGAAAQARPKDREDWARWIRTVQRMIPKCGSRFTAKISARKRPTSRPALQNLHDLAKPAPLCVLAAA